MKFTGLAVVALLAITSSASAIPEPIAEITQLNITSVEDIHTLDKRATYDWFVFFYHQRDCNGGLVDAWGGAGKTGCVKIGGTGYSMGWLPGNTGFSIEVSSTDSCGNQAQCGDNKNCQNFRANIQQYGVQSFKVGC